MKHILTTLALTPLLAMLPTTGQAQKHNLYINYAGSFQINNDSRDGNWNSRFYNRHLVRDDYYRKSQLFVEFFKQVENRTRGFGV